MGSLLALGLAARARSPALRALAAASLLALLPTLYFTFSRGAWIALAAGLIAGAVMDSRRLQLMSAALIAAPAPAIGIFFAWRFKALNQQDALLRDASREGHRLALILVLLALVGAGLTLLRSAVESRVTVGRRSGSRRAPPSSLSSSRRSSGSPSATAHRRPSLGTPITPSRAHPAWLART